MRQCVASAWTVGERELMAAMTQSGTRAPSVSELTAQSPRKLGKGKISAHPDHLLCSP
jgi:hypothetical protein